MTKISTYVVDEKVTALDKWIGSDANMQNRTKNFTPKKLAAYFNEDQVINIGTPLQYKYYTLDPLEARPNGTLTFETEIGPTVNFSSITTFLLSKYTTKQNIVSDFLNFLDGSKILLFKSSDINSFGFYRISSLEPYEPDPNLFIVTVAYETGNGALEEDEDYMISLVSLAGDFIPTKTSELINDGDDGVNPFISELDIDRTEWDAAYEGKINSAEVTGDTTKTLTLTKQDGSTIEASWTDPDTGLTSVGVSMPSAFSVTNSPLTSNGTITITGAGTSLEYVRGDGTLGTFPTLTGYVPYTGATQDVDLGTHQLKADSLAVSTTSTETVDIGEIVWNAIDGTFDMGLVGGVTLQAGQEMHMYGKAAEAISNGQVVMFAGVQGDHILIAKADAATINTNPEYLIGVTSQDFAINDFGYVTVFGNVRGLDTTGYTLGSVLYYNSESATDGLLTPTMPTAPNAKIIVAAVVRVHATQGILLVRPHTMPKIKDIQDVYAPSPSSNNGLFWNSSTLRYENNSIIGALGYTPYNATNPSNYITLGSISSTATGLTYTNTTGVFSLTNGYVIPTTTEESNWNDAYSNRITSASTPLSISSNAISISQAGTSTNGYLTSSDWNIFNNKQVAGNYITSLTGEATASGPGAASVTLNNASVTAKILSGVNITGGTILDTDTMLTAFGKLQNQINSLIGGSIYQGVWNANTNTPALTSSVGTDGYYYIVNVSGSTNLNGITDWKAGDWAIFHGGTWQKVDNTDAVSSVNGFTGAVSLTTDNIPEGTTNLYFTDARVSANTDVAANTASRHNPVTISTIGSINGLNIDVSQQLSITTASSTQNGALTSTDWSTFNNKQAALNGTGFVKISGTTISYDNNTYALDSSVVHLTGDENISGRKTFNSSTDIGIRSNNSGNSYGIYSDNSANGIGIYVANNGSGKAINVANALGSFGNMFEGSYNGTTNFYVNSQGGGYFSNYLTLDSSLFLKQDSNIAFSSGYTTIDTDSSGLYVALNSSKLAYLNLNNITTQRNFTFPDLNGTFALGSGTTNYLAKWSNGNTVANSVIYDNGTNVGIGTSTITYRLQVKGNGLAVQGDNLNEGNSIRFLRASGTEMGYIGWSNESTNNSTWLFKSSNGNPIGFSADGINQSMLININGNVGIGTTSPTNKLDVYGGATSTYITVGRDTGFLEVGAGLNEGFVSSYNSSSVLRPIIFQGSELIFKSSTSATERMRITSGGQVQITQASQTFSDGLRIISGSSRWTQVISGSNIILGYNESDRGSFNSSTGIYTPISDINKKKDFEESTIGLKEILELKPTLYRMKSDDTESDKELGFIAQEVKEFIPQAYVESGEFIGLNFNAIVAALVKSVQEQNVMLQDLKAEIELLKAK